MSSATSLLQCDVVVGDLGPSPPMLSLSKFRKALEIPYGFRRLFIPSEEPVFPNPQLDLRFCIWVALKFESLTTRGHCNLVSEVLCTNKRFSHYWEALELLKKAGVLITSDSVRPLIRAYWQMGLADKAIESFGRMSELGCRPDAHAFNTILNVALRKDLFFLALGVYNLMLKSNCSPDEYTYNVLIDGFCKTDNVKGALEMFDEMDQRNILPSLLTFTIIISGLCHGKKVDDAWRLFNVMRERGCQPDLISYNVLIDGFASWGG
ncbi:hypothetical protein RJT34_25195 [Clitoria ternatea]|uniref:Pentatricopeptide repeat-containing protein n=1 Tax=Clitoria ternatea TaxID=43366 RepID=A0AAN9IGM3_CLITE